jgi:hypothetical protein
LPRQGTVHLASLPDLRRELASLYRAAKRGEIPWPDAARATTVLRELRYIFETSDFEQRLAELEDRLNGLQERAKVNGSGYPRPHLPAYR